ncbi:MAG: hypothetical protein ACRD3M_08470 [Thermoanaerobaculia bacterium]
MSQQATWRCGECEAVVTVSTEDGRRWPDCPNCGAPKEAPGRPERENGGTVAYDTRAGGHFAETAGPQLDRLLARTVLGGEGNLPSPPYSSQDWAAMALAELVGRQSGWSFHLAFCGNAWVATFAEKGSPKKDIATTPLSSLVSASGRTRALAISRALLKVTRSPRWRALGASFLRADPARLESFA